VNLFKMLQQRAANGQPIRVGLVGAGKFGAMYLAQARLTSGIHVLGIADLNVDRARYVLKSTGWPDEQYSASSLAEALRTGQTYVGDDGNELIAADGLDVLIEATGDPRAGIHHCLASIGHGRHAIMVNVEADVVAGPLLARKANAAGVVYSLAYGDQPAIICEQVDWARTNGFEVVCAGKGTRYLPSFHQSTPETVWKNFDFSEEAVSRGMNPKMHNSFIDGTKSAIEMSAVCNACGLDPQDDGLAFPPSSRFELAQICKPKSAGGVLTRSGTTEVVSSLYRDGIEVPHHLQMGTYVIVKAGSDYTAHCFVDYRFLPDQSGQYSALYRPSHMIGLELGTSVASAALRREPTGCPSEFRSDVVATAKKELQPGDVLDGEGGYCVWGKQMPASRSLEIGGLPLGLANNVKLKRKIAQGEHITWHDVEIDEADLAVRMRREMEAAFAPSGVEAVRSAS
jgi:predicted homoserine dehydrogenase-like protein